MEIDIQSKMLVGDSLRVSQILMNLVSNAFKFTDKGGAIHIKVEETSRKGETAFLRFTVSDTGCGMSDEMKARLFKPFEQETADTAKKHSGSGLGLSIAKNLVDMMHGAISVESEKGVAAALSAGMNGHIAKPIDTGILYATISKVIHPDTN
ncbi:MAG: ATP-binding protein [Oscillospiraceae bacterium]|nr:ATP-binding protein [Oscillospiraceae bacterium]